MKENLLTAIFFYGRKFYKYRNISNENSFITFVKMCFPDTKYINFYSKETKKFIKQVKL